MRLSKPATLIALLLASTAGLAACDRSKTTTASEFAANDSGALPPPLPAPAAPLPPAPPAAYAAAWESASAQAERIRREAKAYRQDIFAYDDGPADAWRDGDDIVRVTDPRGRTFYYRPGDTDPYWATWDGRSYAYEGGRPTAVYYSDGRAEAVGGGLVAIALAALTEGRDLHRQAYAPHRPWGPAPGVAYGQGRSDQFVADRGRYDQARNAQVAAEAAAERARQQAVQAGADRAARDRFEAERRTQLQRAADAQRQQLVLYRAQRGPARVDQGHVEQQRGPAAQQRPNVDQERRRADSERAQQQAADAQRQRENQAHQQAQSHEAEDRRRAEAGQARQQAAAAHQQQAGQAAQQARQAAEQQHARQQAAAQQQRHAQPVRARPAPQQRQPATPHPQPAPPHQPAAPPHQPPGQQHQGRGGPHPAAPAPAPSAPPHDDHGHGGRGGDHH